LETARIVKDVLKERGIVLRKSKDTSPDMSIFEKLGEVKNFSWNLFEPLMNGGGVSFNDETFFIEKSQSNPKGLGYPEYFTSDEVKNIPQEVKDTWPHEYVEKIESFESFVDVTERMMSSLERLKKLNDKNYRIIIVTHDALTGSIVNTFTAGQSTGINPGQFISLERKGDDLVATRVGDVTEGNSQDDVIDISRQ